MTTLRDLWKERGLTSVDVAHAASCSIPTIYKLNRRGGEESEVKLRTIRAVCVALNITLSDFERLDACPHADEYKEKK